MTATNTCFFCGISSRFGKCPYCARWRAEKGAGSWLCSLRRGQRARQHVCRIGLGHCKGWEKGNLLRVAISTWFCRVCLRLFDVSLILLLKWRWIQLVRIISVKHPRIGDFTASISPGFITTSQQVISLFFAWKGNGRYWNFLLNNVAGRGFACTSKFGSLVLVPSKLWRFEALGWIWELC